MSRQMKCKAYYPELGMSDPVLFYPKPLHFTFNKCSSYYALKNLPHGTEFLWWTGLTDCNGAGIYEKDVCEHPDGTRFVVVWDNGMSAFRAQYNPDHGNFMLGLQLGEKGMAVVVGNLWENPDLLEGEQ